ncbi:MAG: hypothetical protein NTW31_04860 [Bacteroidetes bacterium]|nr:hypothetical protein [Bacteroidota bacterium]
MKKTVTLIIVVLLAFTARAQEPAAAGYNPSSAYTLSWALSVPLGSFNDFINNVSPAGGNFSGRYFLKKGFAIGFEFGWNNYYEKYPRMTYSGDDGLAITGIHYTYAFVIPWKAGAYYYFMPSAIADPYVGLSFGGDYMEEHIIVQEYDIYETQWGFTLSPELGALIKFGRYSHWGANVSAQYWFNTNSFDFNDFKTYSTMQGLNFNVGLTYILR